MINKKEKGDQGETYASDYLVSKGYTIIERNFTAGKLELDIIAKKEDVLVFVEVRLRANAEYGNPEDLMSYAKINFVKRGAEEYLMTHNWNGTVRFDFIAIIEHPVFELVHFEDAYY
jgi:putative endonuclease